MPSRRSPTFAVYSDLNLQKVPRKNRKKLILLIFLFLILSFLFLCNLYFRRLSGDIALSDARDAVTLAINDAVNRVMTEHDYDYDYFVTLQKDANGAIAAITTNTAHINAVSTEILAEIVNSANSGALDIRIPLGTLLGSNLLLGRGPDVPVEISMLTSSFVSFENSLLSTGINQSRHSLVLKADVDIDIIVPWATMSTTVETDVLIAETVIVGRVPDTYVTLEDTNGSTGSESQNRGAESRGQ